VQQALFDPTGTRAATVHTDGGCDPNPGPGGWAAIVHCADREIVLSGNAPSTTNNQMEIEAAVAALAYLRGRYGRCQVGLYTDSRYLRQGITLWIDDWFSRGWKTKAGRAVKNQGLWRRLYELTHAHDVRWHWIKGHAGNPLNERADQVAREARARLVPADVPGQDNLPDAPKPSQGSLVTVSIGISCLDSDGPGGWAAVIRSREGCTVRKGREVRITSNALYLIAAAESLRAIPRPSKVDLYASSDYLVRGAEEWIVTWRRNGWRTGGGDPVKNRAEWEALLDAMHSHCVTWHAVTGNSTTEDISEAKRIASKQVSSSALEPPAGL
jgi:ribonuclease HI